MRSLLEIGMFKKEPVADYVAGEQATWRGLIEGLSTKFETAPPEPLARSYCFHQL